MSWENLLTGFPATVHAKWNKHKENKVVKVTIYLTFIKWKNVSSYWSDQLKTPVLLETAESHLRQHFFFFWWQWGKRKKIDGYQVASLKLKRTNRNLPRGILSCIPSYKYTIVKYIGWL